MRAREPATPRQQATLLAVAVALAAAGLVTVVREQAAERDMAPGGGSGAPAADPTAPEPTAPRHVVAVQGPTAPSALRVLVTWDRADPHAVAYEVARDEVSLAVTPLEGDAWDDLAYTDHAVEPAATYRYQIRGHYPGGGPGPWSAPATVRVRADGQVGSGRIFWVDDRPGSDLERAQAAVDAAADAGGGVVRFGPRTYAFDGTLVIAGADDVVLRGSGRDETFIQPAFDGSSEPCSPYSELISFRGRRSTLSGVSFAAPVDQGARTVAVTSTQSLDVGDVIVFDERQPQATPPIHESNGILQDPGTGRDLRYPWDANEVVAVSQDAVTFRHPFAYPFSTAVGWERLERGHRNGLEQLTVQGRHAQENTYYRLVSLDHVAGFSLADVRARWANSQYVRASGYDIRVVGFDGPDGGPLSWDTGNCKYKFSVHQAANFAFVDGTMGEPTHDRNQDYLVFQWAQRALVRHSRFWGSRSMAINEHGGGSRGHIYENNYLATGPGSKAAVWLGNTTWGFGGPVIVRNNAFESNARDLYVFENSYGVQFLDNVSRGNGVEGVYVAGWAGPDTPPDLHGSLRLVIARNEWHDARGDGLIIGAATSPWYPFAGARDVIVAHNHLDFPRRALMLVGDASTARHYQVYGNRGGSDYHVPAFGAGVVWADNADGRHHGEPASVGWATPHFAWEAALAP